MTLLKTFTKIAKETASEGKERLSKWAEAEKMRKYKENVERKDAIGSEILFVKKQITETEETLQHLQQASEKMFTVAVNGKDIVVSIQTIVAQYEETLAQLSKRKEKRAKEFLALEEKINQQQDIAEKVQAIEKRKEMRYRTIKTSGKDTAFKELLPLITQLSNALSDGDDLTFEESFGTLELRYKGTTLECFHNGLFINMKLDLFQNIEKVGIVDWRFDEGKYVAEGQADDITLLNWKIESPFDYEDAFFEMTRALKYVYLHHFDATQII